MRRYDKTNNNAYVNLKVCYQIKDILCLSELEFVSSNVNLSLNNFLKVYKDYEDKHNNNKNIRYGVVLTFLLDKEYKNKETISELVNKIVDKYNNLPYFAYLSKVGKGNYLEIYFCERFYYGKDHLISIYAPNDKYRNSKTGYMCKKDDANAVKIVSKGDFIREEVQEFSTKVDLFKFKTEKSFLYAMSELKNFFMNILEKIAGAIIENGKSITKFVERNLSFGRRRRARIWNQTIRNCEDQLNFFIYGLECQDLDDEDNIEILEKTIQPFIDGLKQFRSFNYEVDGRKHLVQINFNQQIKTVRASAELFELKFRELLSKAMFNIIDMNNLQEYYTF